MKDEYEFERLLHKGSVGNSEVKMWDDSQFFSTAAEAAYLPYNAIQLTDIKLGVASDQRVGDKINIIGIRLRGSIRTPRQVSGLLWEDISLIKIALFYDSQTNFKDNVTVSDYYNVQADYAPDEDATIETNKSRLDFVPYVIRNRSNLSQFLPLGERRFNLKTKKTFTKIQNRIPEVNSLANQIPGLTANIQLTTYPGAQWITYYDNSNPLVNPIGLAFAAPAPTDATGVYAGQTRTVADGTHSSEYALRGNFQDFAMTSEEHETNSLPYEFHPQYYPFELVRMFHDPLPQRFGNNPLSEYNAALSTGAINLIILNNGFNVSPLSSPSINYTIEVLYTDD